MVSKVPLNTKDRHTHTDNTWNFLRSTVTIVQSVDGWGRDDGGCPGPPVFVWQQLGPRAQ